MVKHINFTFFSMFKYRAYFGRVLAKFDNSNSLIRWSIPLYQIFKLTHLHD